jgi:glycerate dehydrogenase
VRDGKWVRSLDFCYWDFPLVELHGLKIGIIGFGKIGRAVAKIADAFGMHVIVHTRRRPTDLPQHHVFSELNSLLEWSDVVSLHCPLTPETKHLMNAERLALMKRGAFLLNTSRGPLIDEPALADALNNERLGGAGLDVLSVEPPRADNPLLTAKNCIITPHIAWASRAARERLMEIAVGNLSALASGKPRNVVS